MGKRNKIPYYFLFLDPFSDKHRLETKEIAKEKKQDKYIAVQEVGWGWG